ncbi:MAG: metalloregulator ArsR/SmtB family transcription factor [Actinomycetota bacterium]|nr:metalloregulator ArsR/SmtB family transcription factor [Actinomycetota bacterium]MDA8208149.1 metalloregulator ArsR/SmtB family transcription factor [Actinomycetota bacterium]
MKSGKVVERSPAATLIEVEGIGEPAECRPSVLAAPLDIEEAAELASGFAALADPVRLRMLSLLAAAPAGEICVCDFVAPIGKTQGTISHHLKILGEAGLVHGDRRGKWVWYSLDRQRLAALKGAIEP